MASNAAPSASCGVCSEFCKDPRMLLCLHSFCKKCLQKILGESSSKSSLRCPSCNEVSSVPGQDIESLPKDHRKTNEAKAAEYESLLTGDSTVPCDHCVKGQSAFFCCECCEFLCEKCADHHRSWRKTCDHELISRTKKDGKEAVLKKLPHKPLTCQTHSKESLDYYCNTCSSLLCLRCVVGKHKEHAYEEMESVRDQEKNELVSYLGKAENARDKLKDSISKVEKVIQQVQGNHKQVDQKIEDVFDQLQRKLKARKEALLVKSADVALGKETALTLQCEELKRIETSISEMCVKLESVSSEYTALEMLSAKQPMTARVQQLLGKFEKSSLEPCKLDIMLSSFETALLEEKISALGAVTGGCLAAKSTIDLVKHTAAVGRNRKLILRARDVHGKPFPNGGEPVKATLALMGSGDQTLLASVNDKGDGMYGLSFTPRSTGEHKLSITISNEHIEGSPYVVYVRQPKNYASLSTSSQRTFSVSSNPSDVAIDDNNHVYVAVYGYHCITVFDQNGSQIRTIGTAGGYGSGDGQFNSLYGIAINGDIMYVADSGNNRIQKLTTQGKFISKFGTELSTPQGIAIDRHGRVFVSEYSGNRVSVFEADGTFSYHITGNSSNSTSMNNPWGIAFDSDGNLHVANYSSSRILVFTPEGKYVTQYNSGQYPAGIAIDDEGYTFIGEHYNSNNSYYYSRLYVLSPGHQQIQTVQNLRHVAGVCLDKDGNVYVCDYYSCRVLKY